MDLSSQSTEREKISTSPGHFWRTSSFFVAHVPCYQRLGSRILWDSPPPTSVFIYSCASCKIFCILFKILLGQTAMTSSSLMHCCEANGIPVNFIHEIKLKGYDVKGVNVVLRKPVRFLRIKTKGYDVIVPKNFDHATKTKDYDVIGVDLFMCEFEIPAHFYNAIKSKRLWRRWL